MRCVVAIVVALLGVAPNAAAQAQAKTGSPIVLDAVAMLGPSTPLQHGWFAVDVRLGNPTDSALEGYVEVTSQIPYGRTESSTKSRAPFSIPGKGEVSIELPTHAFMETPDVQVRAHSNDGAELARVEIATSTPTAPFLLDLSVPSRIASFVRNTPVPVSHAIGSPFHYSSSFPGLAVGSPTVVAQTGDLSLPDRPAGYAPATVVLAKSEQITRLVGAELDALGSWVLAGGALAVVPSRPEDLRSGALVAMAGAEIRESAPAPELRGSAKFRVGGSGRSGVSKIVASVELSPSDATRDSLRGYRGGNLRQSPWGASASYGLGELHLLAFDATKAPEVDDRWVQAKVLDLTRHAWERRAALALPHAQRPLDEPRVDEVRKVLDPNEGTRWAIGVAALLLLLYSVLAGPVNFVSAARAGRPLRALARLPFWAGGTLALIVGLGTVAKGVTGSSRRLSLIEAGAGMTRAPVTRFRGFFASSADELTVHASSHDSVLDMAGDSEDRERQVVFDRDGARVERMTAKPWQTVVVREDGFKDLAGGVSVVQVGTELAIANRTSRDLVSVVIKPPGKTARFISRIRDGESVMASSGSELPVKIGYRAAPREIVELGLDAFEGRLEADRADSTAGWVAFAALLGGAVDWWPADVPALIAQVDGGEGKTTDAGLGIDEDHLLLRVIGYGGVQ